MITLQKESNDMVALVTGATRGIGRTIALELSALGYDLALVGRDEEKLAALKAQAEAGGCQAEAIRADLADPSSYQAVIDAAVRRFGGIDVLVNCAGLSLAGPFTEATPAQWDRIFAVNPKAKIVLCTPRKAYGFSGYLPNNCMSDLNGIYLKDYVDIIRQIAEYEGFPLADFYAECGGQRDLARMSMDTALHPNDEGYQMMANVLIPAMKKVITFDSQK